MSCIPSHFDIRTFTTRTSATYDKQSGGKRYDPEDIEDQSTSPICTAISLSQNARKATGIRFSADFQYLLQKKFYDSNAPIGWGEGSSIFHALKVAKNYGLLPEVHWTYTTQADRDLPYHQYIAKLKAVPEQEIQRLLEIAKDHKIKAYAKVDVDRDSMASAIDQSKAGILARFAVNKNWWQTKDGFNSWRKEDLEPLRAPNPATSGHAVTESNYDGRSFRIANTWGCYDKETEVLTINGWKHFSEVKKGELIASLNKDTHTLEYQPALATQKNKYDGELLKFKSQGVDLLVTPNHRMYISSMRDNWRIEKAEDIKARHFKMTKTAAWSGNNIPTHIVDGKKIPMDMWVEFLGYFLSEGHTHTHKYTRKQRMKLDTRTGKYYLQKEREETYYATGISQIKKDSHKTMGELLKKIPFCFTENNGEGWVCASKGLYLELEKFGKSIQKYIPIEIKALPQEKLKILLDALILGDGSRVGQTMYYTSSKILADDVQEIAIKCGYAADIYEDDRIGRVASGGTTNHINYQVSIKPIRKIHKPKDGYTILKEKYNDYVYCVTVNNGVVLVRRNGKSVWCGNSEWANEGTAYHLFHQYRPSEVWTLYYQEKETPPEVMEQLEFRASLLGKLADALQKLIELLRLR